ncbi:MAG: LysM peptidoglycan-binding domain-containing protein, partial [Candidatus Omnitrophica bacterium]|nr:LysM peptidoglycan-binding domain-containing protein [Candidatus Omnitrophota bacterium]
VGLVNDLPSSELAQLLQLAKLRAQTTMSFLSKVKQNALNMDGLQVAFVLNSPDVFAFNTAPGGERVLEVDLMSFMKKPNKAQIAAWRYDFLNILDPQGRVNEIKRFAVNMQSDFINKNADAVKEILRILAFMKNVVDPYFQVGPFQVLGSEEEVAKARQSFFDDLAADGHYAKLAPLLRELGEKVNTYPGKNGQDQKIPNMSERVETVLRHILNNANLKTIANIQGDYKDTDIILLTELSLDAGNSQWFSGSFIDNQKVPDLILEEFLPEQDPAVAALLGEDLDTVFPKATSDELPGWAQETLESAPGELYDDDTNPPGWEDETLGDVALQWASRQFRRAADAVSARINVKQWALSGAIAVMGLFTIGNIGQADVQKAMDADFAKAEQIAVTQQIESDEAWKKSLPQIKPGDTGRIMELMRNLKELKRLQEAVQTEAGTTVEPAEQAAQLDNAVQPAGEYTVKLYDTLGDIAIKFGKNPVRGALEIAAANPDTIENMHLIYPGQRITIPGTTTVTMTLGADDTSMKKVIEKIYGAATSANLKKFLGENPGVKSNSDLRPGAAVTAILPVEQARKFNQSQSAPADSKVSSVGSVGTDNVGGINLDPSGLEIRTEGDHFKFDVPIDPAILQDLQQEPVNGLVPVILNVVPIFNLPQFLGVKVSPSDNGTTTIAS